MALIIKVRGYRGIERADITIDPMALVAGLNHTGKSSIAQAVGAALSGSPIPFFSSSKLDDKPIFTKTDAKGLVRSGMDKGSIEISNSGVRVAYVEWPSGTVEGNGSIRSSRVAAQLIDLMRLPDADRQRFFSELLGAVPNRQDLQVALMETVPSLGDEKGGEMLKRLLDAVDMSGYDAVHTSAKETGARFKGQWDMISGERYGSKKAEGWRPEGWSMALDEISAESLTTDIGKAERAVQDARSKAAVDAAELERLEIAANSEDAAYKAYSEAETIWRNAKAVADKAAADANGIEIPNAIPCPHCGAYVNVMRGESGGFNLLVADDVTDATVLEAEKALAAAQAAARSARGAEQTHQTVYNRAKLAYEAVVGSKQRLEAARGLKGSADDIAVADDYLSGLKNDQERVHKVTETRRIAKLIAENQMIVDILAPEGLRRQKLVKALDTFNSKYLATLCKTADYPAVTLDPDLDVLYGGRRHFLLSESEKYRVRCVLQLAVSLKDGSDVVIFDGADILDPEGREGLFAMLEGVEKFFLVCMTAANKDRVPDLAKANLGRSYWLSGAEAKEIGAEQ